MEMDFVVKIFSITSAIKVSVSISTLVPVFKNLASSSLEIALKKS